MVVGVMLIIFKCYLNLKLCVVVDSGGQECSTHFQDLLVRYVQIIRPVMAVTHQLDDVKVSSYITKQFVTEVITESFIYDTSMLLGL